MADLLHDPDSTATANRPHETITGTLSINGRVVGAVTMLLVGCGSPMLMARAIRYQDELELDRLHEIPFGRAMRAQALERELKLVPRAERPRTRPVDDLYRAPALVGRHVTRAPRSVARSRPPARYAFYQGSF